MILYFDVEPLFKLCDVTKYVFLSVFNFSHRKLNLVRITSILLTMSLKMLSIHRIQRTHHLARILVALKGIYSALFLIKD